MLQFFYDYLWNEYSSIYIFLFGGDSVSKLVYIVDDDPQICELIRKYLKKESFELIKEFNIKNPEMFIMDITMSGMDGFELCKYVRKSSQAPTIFVSARGEELDKIISLELGGDDYISKPFSPRELVARVKSIFRRTSFSEKEAPEEVLTINKFVVKLYR